MTIKLLPTEKYHLNHYLYIQIDIQHILYQFFCRQKKQLTPDVLIVLRSTDINMLLVI